MATPEHQAELEALQARVDTLTADFDGVSADLTKLVDLARLCLSTLCWYADPEQYDTDHAEMDAGQRAREALGRATWAI